MNIAKPTIREQPESKTVGVNEMLELRCIAKCIPEPPDYQWFYGDSVPLKGAKSWKLMIPKVMMNHSGYYCCRIQNRRLKDDRYAVFSQYAKVTVIDQHVELGNAIC